MEGREEESDVPAEEIVAPSLDEEEPTFDHEIIVQED